MTLPADVARCTGVSDDGVWREGCEDCLRRTSPPADAARVPYTAPPAIVVFECELRIEPDSTMPNVGGEPEPTARTNL